MSVEKDEKLKSLLKQEYNLLLRAIETLKMSIDKCVSIGEKQEYSFEEQESFDSLTSKFGRTSDLYTQKVIRTVWMLLHEPFMPFIDLLQKSEKIGLIESADSLIEIRDLRNQIAHEYIPEAINNLVPDVISLSKALFENIEYTKTFLSGRNWI